MGYWKTYLDGIPTVHSLPLDRPRPAVQSYAGQLHTHMVNQNTMQQLQQLAREHDVTLYMVLSAAFATLISRYSGEQDIVIGSAIANREHAEVEGLIGFFINTLLVRTNFSDNPNFLSYWTCEADSLNAYEYQQVPFEKLVDELQPERNLSHNPLFQIMLTLQNTDESDADLGHSKTNDFDQDERVAQFDLSLDVLETPNGLELSFEYATDLFNAETIERMAAHIELLLAGIAVEPARPVTQISMISDGGACWLVSTRQQWTIRRSDDS